MDLATITYIYTGVLYFRDILTVHLFYAQVLQHNAVMN